MVATPHIFLDRYASILQEVINDAEGDGGRRYRCKRC